MSRSFFFPLEGTKVSVTINIASQGKKPTKTKPMKGNMFKGISYQIHNILS